MADYNTRYQAAQAGTRTDVQVDEGLRSYLLGVYNYMGLGIALTGVVAYFTYYMAATNPAVAQALYVSPLKWVVIFAPLAMVFLFSATVNRMSAGMAQMCFWAFAALMGVSLSSIFIVYTGQSIAQIFFVTAAAFGGLSLWGYTTKQDISGWGSFLFMGLIGIILASIVNIWLGSPALMFAVSVIGVLVFAGLTAYDTQRLKTEYLHYAQHSDAATINKSAISGALSLYLNFINMFIMLLQLFGSRE